MSSTASLSPDDDATDIQALVCKLGEIGDEIERGRRHLEHLVVEFNRVDSIIRAVSGQEKSAGHRLMLGGTVERSVPNMILQVLEGAEEPMSAREIAQEIVKLQGADASCVALLKPIMHRVCVSLWVQNQKGLVKKTEVGRSRFRWHLVRQ